ncbi:MAG: iron ABC transporter permease [Phycisphaerales bacterium]
MRAAPTLPIALGGTLVVIGAVVASLCIGVYPVPLADVATSIGDLLAGRAGTSTNSTLILEMRLPRAVAAACVGASLGTAGCMLQALLRNPLASPFVIGTAQGAGFGAVLAIVLGLSYAATISFGFVMSLIAVAMVLGLARSRNSLPTESVVLTGLSISLFFGSLIGLLRYMAHDEGVTGRISLWMLGGLWQVTWAPLIVVGPVAAVAIVASCLLSRHLDLLALGEEDAARLGVNVRRAGSAVLLLTCVMTAVAVCIGGILAFVGLVVPHAARKLVGPGHSALMPACACLGALLVIATDALARTAVPPQELPLGVVTSLIGVPCFLAIMRSMRSRRGGA